MRRVARLVMESAASLVWSYVCLAVWPRMRRLLMLGAPMSSFCLGSTPQRPNAETEPRAPHLTSKPRRGHQGRNVPSRIHALSRDEASTATIILVDTSYMAPTIGTLISPASRRTSLDPLPPRCSIMPAQTGLNCTLSVPSFIIYCRLQAASSSTKRRSQKLLLSFSRKASPPPVHL